MKNQTEADIIIIGAGLAGLVAAAEAADAKRKVLIIEQEPESSLGGQAFWSLGGLFIVDSPEQRRLGIRDSHALATQDWFGSAGFDRPEDHWPKQWAQAYIDFAAGEKRSWLLQQGLKLYPLVGWAERGGYLASNHGNSVPRFHITKGAGPGILEPFIARVQKAQANGLIRFCFRHKVTELVTNNGIVTGVIGQVLAADAAERGKPSSRTVIGDFHYQAQAVIVTSGGIGGNHELVRHYWPERMGKPPQYLLAGVPDYVDGSMLNIAVHAGANLINMDRMWHYPEGIHNYASLWTKHAIRILSGPSPLWLDADGKRLPSPLYPGCDTLGALAQICKQGDDYSWFLINQRILGREFALSGSEQNPDLTTKSTLAPLMRILPGAPKPVKAFVNAKIDFIVETNLHDLVNRMNQLVGNTRLDAATVATALQARDREVSCGLGKDTQLMMIRNARRYWGDKLFRVEPVHEIADPKSGPLIAVRLSILTRKTLGGLETNLQAQVMNASGAPIAGLYAAGEVTGFGGGGVHGYRALEGTFLGGCIFSGRTAGRSASVAIA